LLCLSFGRPYDYNFDFITDSALVCSELVYKAYEPSNETRGLNLPLETMMGRKLMPVNSIAKSFSKQYSSSHRKLDFVFFLDGLEKKKRLFLVLKKLFLLSGSVRNGIY
jgi:hypothetical protein